MLKVYYSTLLVSFIFIIFSFSSCKKDNSVIGLGVQPEGDYVVIDYDSTITFTGQIVLDDSVSTSNLTYNLLGCYQDPVYGKAKAEIITQISISSNNVDFQGQFEDENELLYADSLILSLEFVDYYGKNNVPQDITIYRISDYLDDTITYYSNYELSGALEEVGSITYQPSFDEGSKDTVYIPLSLSFAEELLLADTSHYVDNESFVQFLNGLYISVGDVEDGCLMTCNLISSLSGSKMTLYYNDSLSFNYLMNSGAARFSIFEHDYSTASFSGIEDGLQDSILYLQSAGGTNATISFHNYEHWMDSSIAVLKAELILTTPDYLFTDTNYFAPVERMLFYIEEGEDDYSFPPDYLIDGTDGQTYFNGYLDEQTREYRYNITRYFQELIDGSNPNNTLKLFPQSNRIKAERIAIGCGDSAYPIKLSLTYTKL